MAFVQDALNEDIIDPEEYLLLYNLNKRNNLNVQYNDYNKFNLESYNDDECNTFFRRFRKEDIYRLQRALQIEDDVKCVNGLKVTGIETLCILLKRFAYPCRYIDMVPMFARPIPQLCMITNMALNYIYNGFEHLFSNCFRQPWLSPGNMERFAAAIYDSGAAIDNCWGFVDGTVRPICRPGEHQRIVYNGHKRVHSLKFQSVVTPNGLIANLFGPIEGCRHDAFMLRESNLLQQLERYAVRLNGDPLCIYGDPAYPLRVHLQAPFKGNLTQGQQDFNRSMSQARVSVEWLFRDIIENWKFVDFKKTQKIGLSAIGKIYVVCCLLTNAHTCLYGNITSKTFKLDPPALEEYFR
ncbi:uncharacterized protein [Antedon mediterranea]|uniref:uncharacterized protein n=1 Tax=Antedon mediterranea TaxID=105859 RepID=UPI003AF664F3